MREQNRNKNKNTNINKQQHYMFAILLFLEGTRKFKACSDFVKCCRFSHVAFDATRTN